MSFEMWCLKRRRARLLKSIEKKRCWILSVQKMLREDRAEIRKVDRNIRNILK